jgi:hypothetical protein
MGGARHREGMDARMRKGKVRPTGLPHVGPGGERKRSST